MSYQPFDRNPSGIVFFGTTSTDQVYESASNFTFGGDVLSVPNITLGDSGELGSTTTPDALVISSDGTVTIAGDLTVNGTQTILNTQTVEIEDNILLLNSNVTGSPTLDAGLEIERGTSDNVFITFDEGNDNWHFTNDGSTYHDMWTGLTVGGDVNADEAIVEGETLTVAGGSGLTTTMTTNTVTIDVDATIISGQSAIVSVDSANDYLLVLDATDGNLKKVTKGDLVSDLGGGTVTSIGITSDTLTITNSPITTAGDIDLEVKVDNATIGLNGSNELEVIGGLDKTLGTPTDGQTITSDVNLVTTGGSNATVTLPAVASGKQVTIKKIDSGTGLVIVQRNSADVIDGAVSKTLYYQYEAITVISNGTDWFIV